MADGNFSPSKSLETFDSKKSVDRSCDSPTVSTSSKSDCASPAVTTSSSPKNRRNSASGSNTKERRGGYQKRNSGSDFGGGGKDKRSSLPSTSSSTATTPTTTEETSASAANTKSGQQTGSSKRSNNKKFSAKKRAAPREDFNVKPNDVFVNEKSHFVAQLAKCKKLFAKGHREIHLHGLGKAIPRAVNIAFELKKIFHNTVDYNVNTSTIKVFDDLVDIEEPGQPCAIMFFNLQELGQWLGVTAYEIWVWLTSLAVFTVLLTLKCDGNVVLTWWNVFTPLFIGDALNAYFVITVFIRMYIAKRVRPATLRTLWSLLQLVLVFLFEYLLCWKLTEPNQFEYSEVMAPLFILSQFIMIRACQLH